jgi:hypothetical protein
MTIVPIRPGLALPPPGEINENVVSELEDLLEQARAGEIVGIAYALEHPGKTTSFQRAGFCTRGLLGAVTLLQAQICRNELDED